MLPFLSSKRRGFTLFTSYSLPRNEKGGKESANIILLLRGEVSGVNFTSLHGVSSSTCMLVDFTIVGLIVHGPIVGTKISLFHVVCTTLAINNTSSIAILRMKLSGMALAATAAKNQQ
jgi:hypothetical protein